MMYIVYARVQVKILYIRNLMMTTTEETIEALCNEWVKREDAVERVKKIRDYAFVHFKEREDAITAMNLLNGTSIISKTTPILTLI